MTHHSLLSLKSITSLLGTIRTITLLLSLKSRRIRLKSCGKIVTLSSSSSSHLVETWAPLATIPRTSVRVILSIGASSRLSPTINSRMMMRQRSAKHHPNPTVRRSHNDREVRNHPLTIHKTKKPLNLLANQTNIKRPPHTRATKSSLTTKIRSLSTTQSSACFPPRTRTQVVVTTPTKINNNALLLHTRVVQALPASMKTLKRPNKLRLVLSTLASLEFHTTTQRMNTRRRRPSLLPKKSKLTRTFSKNPHLPRLKLSTQTLLIRLPRQQQRLSSLRARANLTPRTTRLAASKHPVTKMIDPTKDKLLLKIQIIS